jgi:tRNA dimethylallyltransferase
MRETVPMTVFRPDDSVGVPVLVGPTAVGKSSLGLALARRLREDGVKAEIVNADSMLVYTGMDVGTAKPSAPERAEVPHHLIDILDITQTATVAQFQQLARDAIADCRRRSVVPVLVGGSALYVRAIVDDFEFPGTDPELRGRLEDELALVGAEAMHSRLAALDPDAAARIEPANGRRIVRALEVGALTGAPYTAQLPSRTYLLPGVTQIGLDLPRPDLDLRIEQRVDHMWDEGFVDEVRRLEAAGLRAGVTASRALGYRQVLQFLAGEISEQQARDATVYGTRRFARRQDSWFRKDERIRWLPALADDRVERAYRLLR